MNDHHDPVNQDQPYRLIEKPPTVQFSHPYQAPTSIVENPHQINSAMNMSAPFPLSNPTRNLTSPATETSKKLTRPQA